MVNIFFFSFGLSGNTPFKPCTNITMISLTERGISILFSQIKAKMFYNI